MGPAAQLLVEAVADGHHAHPPAVLLAEQGDRPGAAGLLQAHDLGGHGQVLGEALVDEGLDVADLRAGQGRAVAEVEAQARGGVLAARLVRVLPHHAAQAPVDHVGARVGAGDGQAALDVDAGVGPLPHGGRPLGQGAAVDGQAAHGGLHVVDLDEAAAGQADGAPVGELAAHLGVEGGAVQDDLDLGGGRGRRLRRAVDEQPGDDGVGGRLGVAQEGRAPAHAPLDVLEGADVGVTGLLGARVGAGALLLLVHEGAEGGLVDVHALLGGHLQGQVDGEAVGVVQLEGAAARHERARGGAGPPPGGVPGGTLGGGHRGVQDGGAGGQGAPEGVLLGVGDLADRGPLRLQLGVGGPHGVLGGGQQGRHGGVLHAQQAHGAHGAADEAAQDVAAPVVAGAHAVGDEHEGGADVVGDHAHAHVVLPGGARVRPGGAAPVAAPAHGLGRRDDGVDLVDLVHVRLVLHDEGQALQAGAGVDGGALELADELEVVAPALAADELVEDEVPDLQEAVAPGIDGGPAVGPVVRAAIVVDLTAGAGGPGLAGGPGDLGEGEPLDAALGHPDRPGQVVPGDLVLLPDRHPQPLAVQPVAAPVRPGGQQLPGVVDGPLLEVVPEGEVAAHLEEGAVARGAPDVVDVVGADALLHAGRARPGRLLRAQDVGDEGHHAGDGEQDRGLRGDQGHRGADLVPVRGEVVEPAGADLGGAHEVLNSSVVRGNG